MRRIAIRLHGITLELRSDSEALLGYVAAAMRDAVVAPGAAADVDVVARWDDGDDALAPELAPVDVRLDPVRDRDLALGFTRDAATGRFRFDVRYRYRPSAKKLVKHPDHLHRKLFEMLRWVALFPIAWTLERRRSWVLLHGAAVARDGAAVVLLGAGGAGKTTTALALAARRGMTVLGENLLLWDGAAIHGIGEPARAERSTVALVDPVTAGLALADAPGGSGKLMYRLDPSSLVAAARPRVLVLLDEQAPPAPRRLPSDEAHERLLAAHRLTTEIQDYDAYAAALDFAWPTPGHTEAMRTRLGRLFRNTPTFVMGIDRSAGIDAAVAHVLDAAPRAQEIAWTPR
jgi:hypothetical protein